MKYERASQGNVAGIKEVVDSFNPLFRKNFMCTKALDKLLKKLAYDSGNKKSESELIREALIKVYTNT